MPQRKATEEDLWCKVSIPANVMSDCWGWMAAVDKNGYGKVTVRLKDLRAHRVSWSIFNGDIPSGMFVLHRCDNPPCVNPAHLFLGTNSDNMMDKVSKGRANAPSGEGHWISKMTWAGVMDMRRRRAAGESTSALAAEYKIAAPVAGKIIAGTTWRER